VHAGVREFEAASNMLRMSWLGADVRNRFEAIHVFIHIWVTHSLEMVLFPSANTTVRTAQDWDRTPPARRFCERPASGEEERPRGAAGKIRVAEADLELTLLVQLEERYPRRRDEQRGPEHE
jgi:hypothetical protein